MQTRRYNIFDESAPAASTEFFENFRDSVPTDNVVVLGVKVRCTSTITLGAAPATQTAPTKQELYALMDDQVSSIELFDARYGNLIQMSPGQLAALIEYTHGIQPVVRQRVGVNGQVGSTTVELDWELFVPFISPVGREAVPMSKGGRGRKRHAPSAGQLRSESATMRITTGLHTGGGGGLTFQGAAFAAYAAGPTLRADYFVEPVAGSAAVRVAPMQYQTQQSATGLNSLPGGRTYFGIAVDEGSTTASTIGASALEVRFNGALLYEAARVNAQDLVLDAITAHTFGGGAQVAPDALDSNIIPIQWPDPCSHKPLVANDDVTIQDQSGGTWGFGVAEFVACFASNQIAAPSGAVNLGTGLAAPVLLTSGAQAQAAANAAAQGPLNLLG